MLLWITWKVCADPRSHKTISVVPASLLLVRTHIPHTPVNKASKCAMELKSVCCLVSGVESPAPFFLPFFSVRLLGWWGKGRAERAKGKGRKSYILEGILLTMKNFVAVYRERDKGTDDGRKEERKKGMEIREWKDEQCREWKKERKDEWKQGRDLTERGKRKERGKDERKKNKPWYKKKNRGKIIKKKNIKEKRQEVFCKRSQRKKENKKFKQGFT